MAKQDEWGVKHTSQNSLMNCLHMPQGLAGGLISVATASALKSPRRRPWKYDQLTFFPLSRLLSENGTSDMGRHGRRYEFGSCLYISWTCLASHPFHTTSQAQPITLYVSRWYSQDNIAEQGVKLTFTTAVPNAVLSAHVPTGYEAFSTFAP